MSVRVHSVSVTLTFGRGHSKRQDLVTDYHMAIRTDVLYFCGAWGKNNHLTIKFVTDKITERRQGCYLVVGMCLKNQFSKLSLRPVTYRLSDQ
ncbi:hypothetical protein BaRGS_00001493 [Batillaria attramentaria]|uniref:Uncharacterized protein n=1 Tax=Batillaria attramentaria TaxID=370345 RepID=A0ABD0M8I8_9CAEN